MEMKDRIIGLLTKLGFTNGEAKFYLSLLRKPGATMGELLRDCRISKSAAYRMEEKFRSLRLLHSSENEWRKNLYAVPLKRLAEIVSAKQRNLRKIELELKRLDNLFELSQSSGIEEPFQVFTDQEEISEQYTSAFSKKWDHFLCYGSTERLPDVAGNAVENAWVKTRAKQGRGADVLITEIGDYAREFLPRDEREFRRTKIAVDPKNQNFCLCIYDNDAMILENDPELGKRLISVNDPMLVRLYKNLFGSLWQTAA